MPSSRYSRRPLPPRRRRGFTGQHINFQLNKTLAAGDTDFTYANLGFNEAFIRPNKPLYMLFRMAAAIPTPVKIAVFCSDSDSSLDPTATSTTRIIGTSETRILVRLPRSLDYSTTASANIPAFRVSAGGPCAMTVDACYAVKNKANLNTIP
jgi:hypothetical protein